MMGSHKISFDKLNLFKQYLNCFLFVGLCPSNTDTEENEFEKLGKYCKKT